MPLRIYDIAKKLGLENKEVLAKAKELGISAARVASSTLDKITGEYLEEQLRKDHPQPTANDEPGLSLPPPAPVLDSGIIGAMRSTSLPSVSTPPIDSRVSPERTELPLKRERDAASSPSNQFERRIRHVIQQQYPFCALSNVLLFHAERARFGTESISAGQSDYALEMDHLLHRATEGKDVLTIVECKNQPVTVQDEKTWEVAYFDSPQSGGKFRTKNVQAQVERHARAIRSYVNPLSRGRRLHVEVIVVSSHESTITRRRNVNSWLSLYLMSPATFTQVLTMMTPAPLRVVQSDLLGLLRLGMPVPELGHPELTNAIAYIERCRRDLDGELFRAFEPTKERWAINGSAGMGKSVLLAYSLFVLTTDRKIQIREDTKSLVNFADEATQLNLPPLGQRAVYAFALKEKQRQVIEVLFRRFVDEFASLSKDTDLGMRRPAIRLWTGKIPDDCHVLVLDEAHDLSSAHAKLLSDWINQPGKRRYLLIACDRHQKLRLVGRDENIIEGVSFSLKTKKLRLNYRNPFAVYAASLGLMFRWFAKSGPKVIPTRDDLENGFGFTVEQLGGSQMFSLSMRNDAHPANGWSDCVSIFPNCEAVLSRLRPCRFRCQDVLWVRFSDEDEHFDYEQLNCFTYHNLNSPESIELTDKYIKGQDFPIVVIEGFSEDMDKCDSPETEQRMWQRRKELYICASRATGFLFFIPRVPSSESPDIQTEVESLVRQLATPHRDSDGFGRTWRFELSPTSESRKMDVFVDTNETANKSPQLQFVLGRLYSRREISEVLGGSESDFLPTRDGKVVCGCFTRKHNPDAPNVVIPGSGPIIEQQAEIFCRQTWPVPIFVKQRPNEWEYVGAYKAERFSTDRAEISGYHRNSITPLNQITRVIFLAKSQS